MDHELAAGKTIVLGRKNVEDLDHEQEIPPDLMTVNMGPSHPAMHGTVRIILTVDGEHDPHGAVHRGVRRAHVDRHELAGERLLLVEILEVLAAEDELLEITHGAAPSQAA